jgi:hypothetical protein
MANHKRFPEHLRVPAEHRMMIARAIAIQAYAALEQSLCFLFAHLSDTSQQVAGTIFFRITNAASRVAILEKLMRMKHGNANRLFFNSVIAAIRPLDGKRNEIIHWHTTVVVGDGPTPGEAWLHLELAPPNFWVRDKNTPSILPEDMMAFEAKCDFWGRAINMLTMHLMHGPLDGAWPEIFEQPLGYPPLEAHPLFRQPSVRPTLPEPSPG